ncbi:hypothetical protein O6H91_09G071700 [Diphasiastrum complanatum]|uniref:Uncharacterized protein n=1 Tax=Diphasiastrum complanatum TaxID=34168 RepID=A0ACC2CQM8_DIPCM|nr:hypothetical protein O6H91_09G071700 [Diphasiastrum complanatum]
MYTIAAAQGCLIQKLSFGIVYTIMFNLARAQVFLVMILCSLRPRGVVEAKGLSPMFVFGDSYLDTGNRDNLSRPWNPPYGMTWPDRPAGRYSDGHSLTDVVAKAIGSSSPIPYRVCNEEIYRSEIVKYGVNFAVGGSGAFQGLINTTNLRGQVDNLVSLLEAHSIELPPPQRTLALLCIGGNDYTQFFKANGSRKVALFLLPRRKIMYIDVSGFIDRLRLLGLHMYVGISTEMTNVDLPYQDLPDLTRRIVGGITENLKRLHDLGVRKFAVFNLGPLGCIPKHTAINSYKYCISALNIFSEHHNRVFVQEVHATLSALEDTDFIILDQYRAFLLVINQARLFGFKHRLKPCCQIKPGRITECGLRDENGEPLYEVCSDPENYFFWDGEHLTQAGWIALVAIIIENQNFNQQNPIQFGGPADHLALNRPNIASAL